MLLGSAAGGRNRVLGAAERGRSQGKAEETVEADPVDSALREVVGGGGGGQRVVAIMMDGVPLGADQPFLLAVEDGQHVLTVPAGQVVDETVVGDGGGAEEEENPLARKPKVDQNVGDSQEDGDGAGREALQLQEANGKAREHRGQLMKEQEAEEHGLKPVAVAGQQPHGAEGTAFEEVPAVEQLVVTSEDIREPMLAVVEADQPTDIAVETVTS